MLYMNTITLFKLKFVSDSELNKHEPAKLAYGDSVSYHMTLKSIMKTEINIEMIDRYTQQPYTTF